MAEDMPYYFTGEILDEFIPCTTFGRGVECHIGHPLPYAVMERFKHTHPTIE